MILNYLDKQATNFNFNCDTAKESIIESVNLLFKSGKVTDDYVDDVLKGYEKFGSYFVLTPHFALPHAQPSEKVKETAISFLKLEHPITFDHEYNDPVHYVITLAGVNGTKHKDLLRDLMKFLSNEIILSELPNINNFEELKQLLEEENI